VVAAGLEGRAHFVFGARVQRADEGRGELARDAVTRKRERGEEILAQGALDALEGDVHLRRGRGTRAGWRPGGFGGRLQGQKKPRGRQRQVQPCRSRGSMRAESAPAFPRRGRLLHGRNTARRYATARIEYAAKEMPRSTAERR